MKGTIWVMTRILAVLLALASILIGVASDSPAGGKTAAQASGSVPAEPISGGTYLWEVNPASGQNPMTAIPNPGTGAGNPLLVRALLPHSSSGLGAAFLVPAGVVALPDRDRRSLFIGLRQFSSPVIGPQVCDGWTAGLWTVVTSSYNRAGVQLAISEEGVPTQAGLPLFSEALISGPASVISALANPPLPAACRDITTPSYSGGVKPVAAAAPDPGPGLRAVSARAFEVTGTGKFPVWQWVEVIQGRGFLLEIRIPDQSGVSKIPADPGAALATIAANAYRRAAAILTA
jgi:hypothetical protein